MLKKITVCVLCLVFALSVSIYSFAQSVSPDIAAGNPAAAGNSPSQSSGRAGGEPPQAGMDKMPPDSPAAPPMGGAGEGNIPGGGNGEANIPAASATEETQSQPSEREPQGGEAMETASPNIPAAETAEQEQASPAAADASAQQPINENNGRMFQNPAFSQMTGMQGEQSPFDNFMENYFTPLFSLVILALAFIFVIFYKRRW